MKRRQLRRIGDDAIHHLHDERRRDVDARLPSENDPSSRSSFEEINHGRYGFAGVGFGFALVEP